jgi:putative GTP pyrophosphokinase
MSLELLRIQYSDNVSRANRLRETMATQLSELLDRGQITLGVPMESRVKAWSSIEEKVERKRLALSDIKALDDFVGIRLILLFRADLGAVEGLITGTFEVLSSEDTAKRLGEAQFGYQSQHYILRLPKAWLAIPSMADLGELKVEIQVRTLAQHIWAAASHKLQYKHEESVPPPLRRTIHRVSALLETVDLEFDRVLAERKDYREVGISATTGSEPLNVDLLAAVLGDVFPLENREEEEDYENLLSDLRKLSIYSVDQLKKLLEKHLDAAMSVERTQLANRVRDKNYRGTTEERVKSGVFYTHAGLARAVLLREFGNKAEKLFLARPQRRNKPLKS